MIFDVCMYAGVFRQRGPHQAAYCLCVYVYMYIGMIFDVYVRMYVCMQEFFDNGDRVRKRIAARMLAK